jgi:hypothetical protein
MAKIGLVSPLSEGIVVTRHYAFPAQGFARQAESTDAAKEVDELNNFLGVVFSHVFIIAANLGH